MMASNSNRAASASSPPPPPPRSKHYYQGGYDYDFVDDLAAEFECPICLLCQRDPHQTSCGHRFCYSCILTWLNEGRTCPKDACSLGEGDIFADTIAHREILQLMVKCPRRKEEGGAGCASVMRLSDVENHARQCGKDDDMQRRRRKNTATDESLTCESCGEVVDEEAAAASASAQSDQRLICPNAEIACPYTSAGCADRVPRKDLHLHVQTNTQRHMQLLCERLMKLHQIQSVGGGNTEPSSEPSSFFSGPDSLPSGGEGAAGLPLRAEDVRMSGSNAQATQKLLRDLFQRVVQLEQKNCQLEIANAQLDKRLRSLPPPPSDAGRFCQGRFVWTLGNFARCHERMRRSRSHVEYSPAFYTSAFGYRVCLRCNVTLDGGEEHLGLFVHLAAGENDAHLAWPFRGSIALTAVNQAADRLHRENFTEVLDATSASHQLGSLERPSPSASSADSIGGVGVGRSAVGYGFPLFIRMNGLYSGGFVGADDSLVIRARVQPVDDDDWP